MIEPLAGAILLSDGLPELFVGYQTAFDEYASDTHNPIVSAYRELAASNLVIADEPAQSHECLSLRVCERISAAVQSRIRRVGVNWAEH